MRKSVGVFVIPSSFPLPVDPFSHAKAELHLRSIDQL
jgi:hypothetical protein